MIPKKIEWKHIIQNKDREKIIKKIDEIAKSIEKYYLNEQSIGLHGGLSGITLFFAEYSKFKNDPNYSEKYVDCLGRALNIINAGGIPHTLCDGLAGYAWILDYLNKKQFIEIDEKDMLNDIDEYLVHILIDDIERENIDFLHGSIGVLSYLLKRNFHINYKDILNEYLMKLEKQSIKFNTGSIAWKKNNSSKPNIDEYDFGLSHGIPAVVVLLCKIYSLTNDSFTKELLENSVKFLLENIQDKSKFKTYFASITNSNGTGNNSRLAWCYGDLGVSFSLYISAITLNRSDLYDISNEILLNSTQRNINTEVLEFDAGFCHGTAGVAHIYNRFYHYTGNIEYLKSTKYWIEQTMLLGENKNGLSAGFKKLKTDSLEDNYNYIEGIAGIGLVLMSVISDIEPTWDESMLIS